MGLTKELFDKLYNQCEEEIDNDRIINIKIEIKRCLRSIKQQEQCLEEAKKNLFDHINKYINSSDCNN